MIPDRVQKWLIQAYPRPCINQEWLDSCCDWIQNDLGLDPEVDSNSFVHNVEHQLLESDLCDSTDPNTGFPAHALEMDGTEIRGDPILVEVTALTEIGSSAFSLANVRQARIERADLAGLAQAEGAEDDGGPIPKYPRRMLRMEVSDGSIIMPAIEFRSMPSLDLAETPLGYKLILKNPMVRRGMLLLEPKNTLLKGGRTEGRDAYRDRDFLRSLYNRMSKPVPDNNEESDGANNDDDFQPPPPPPRAPLNQARSTPAVPPLVRHPFRDISEPEAPDADEMSTDVDANLLHSRHVPDSRSTTTPFPPSSSSTLVNSRYFSGSERESPAITLVDSPVMGQMSRVLSPARGDPFDVFDSSMEEDPDPPKDVSKGKERASTVYEDSDFDMGEVDASFWDACDKIEREALKDAPKSGTNEPQSSSLKSPKPKKKPTAPPNAKPQHTHIHGKTTVISVQEVITIDDDDDNNKENVPVQTRRVRRRLSSQASLDSNIINISD